MMSDRPLSARLEAALEQVVNRVDHERTSAADIARLILDYDLNLTRKADELIYGQHRRGHMSEEEPILTFVDEQGRGPAQGTWSDRLVGGRWWWSSWILWRIYTVAGGIDAGARIIQVVDRGRFRQAPSASCGRCVRVPPEQSPPREPVPLREDGE